MTILLGGVKPHSFFDSFCWFSRLVLSPGLKSGHPAGSRDRSREGRVRVYSEALGEENRRLDQEQDRIPRFCSSFSGWRRARSPSATIARCDPQGSDGEQVSKGLTSELLAEENRGRQNPGILNFLPPESLPAFSFLHLPSFPGRRRPTELWA